MQIHVLHLHRESLRHPHRLVAIVEPPIGLESIIEEVRYSIRATQNSPLLSWSVDQKNERVKVMDESGTDAVRSTAQGDLLLAGGDLWMVKEYGAVLLTPRYGEKMGFELIHPISQHV